MRQGPAMTRARPHRRRLGSTVVLTVVLLALTACATRAATSGGEQRLCPSDQASARPATTSDTLGTPTRLNAIADTITAVPADTRAPTAYPYSAVHTQQWAITGDSIQAHDVITWRAADGTARTQTRTLALRRDPTQFPDPAERQRLATAPAEIVNYPLANGAPFDGVVPEPVPHDPQALADALNSRNVDCRPHLLLDQYLQLAASSYLDRQARAATLRLLATIPDLTYIDIARDLAGRTGWAFTLNRPDRHTTDTIVIDPTTGLLLTAATAQSNSRQPQRITLYLERNRTTTREQPPSP
jgi:hypothetical protein